MRQSRRTGTGVITGERHRSRRQHVEHAPATRRRKRFAHRHGAGARASPSTDVMVARAIAPDMIACLAEIGAIVPAVSALSFETETGRARSA